MYHQFLAMSWLAVHLDQNLSVPHQLHEGIGCLKLYRFQFVMTRELTIYLDLDFLMNLIHRKGCCHSHPLEKAHPWTSFGLHFPETALRFQQTYLILLQFLEPKAYAHELALNVLQLYGFY